MQVAISRVRKDGSLKPRLALVIYLETKEEELVVREYISGARKRLTLGHNDKTISVVEAEEGVVEP